MRHWTREGWRVPYAHSGVESGSTVVAALRCSCSNAAARVVREQQRPSVLVVVVVGPSGRHSVASSTRTPKKRRTSSTTSSASIYVQPRARTYEGFDAARELSKSATASE